MQNLKGLTKASFFTLKIELIGCQVENSLGTGSEGKVFVCAGTGQTTQFIQFSNSLPPKRGSPKRNNEQRQLLAASEKKGVHVHCFLLAVTCAHD